MSYFMPPTKKRALLYSGTIAVNPVSQSDITKGFDETKSFWKKLGYKEHPDGSVDFAYRDKRTGEILHGNTSIGFTHFMNSPPASKEDVAELTELFSSKRKHSRKRR